MEKKFKAQEKLTRRMERKLAPDVEEPEHPAEEVDDEDDVVEESI